MATVRDIATQVGVSIATVSRALNEPEKVSPETLRVVKKAMQEMDYKKKAPVRKRTNLFGVIFPNISNPFFAELLEIIENEAFHNGRCVMFFNSRHNLRQEKLYLQECESHGVDGVFLVPHCIDDDYLETIKKLKFHTVLLTQTSHVLPSVAVDHREGGRLVASHLLSSGHTNIGYVGPISPREDKYVGFVEKLESRHITLNEVAMFDTEIGADIEAYIENLMALDDQKKVSAIFCVNDVFAQKIIEALVGRGVKVPQEVVVVGFDNSLTSKILNISSISQPMREIAHVGFEQMLTLMQENKKLSGYTPQLLLPRLVMRESSIQIKEEHQR